MKLKKKSNQILRLQRTFKFESTKEVVRQLTLNYLFNNNAEGCYIGDIFKYVKSNKFINTMSPSTIFGLVQEALLSLSDLVQFKKNEQDSVSKIMVIPTPSFYTNFYLISATDITHTKANCYIEDYLEDVEMR